MLRRVVAGAGVAPGGVAMAALAANGWRDFEEIVNVLYAQHEMTREHAGAVVKFFEGHSG